jgi:hypothetical protein
MKKVAEAAISLFFLVFIVQVARAADVEMNGSVGVSGSLTATSFSGDGSSLTNLSPANLSGGTAGISITGNAATAGTANSVATGAVNTSGIATGAVTPDKIAFYGKVAVVAMSGGDYTDPATAMSDSASWCGTHLSTNPCLLKIMPGIYTVTSPVVMQQYIDIEGSGENTTRITSAISSSSLPLTQGTVIGASHAEIRFLKVGNTGSGSYTAAILNSSNSPSIFKVTATASGGSTISSGVYNDSSSPVMTNVTATGSGGNTSSGVYNASSSSPVMTNVTATGSGAGTYNYGVYNIGSGTVKIDHSVISGSTNTIDNLGGPTYVGDTQINGGPVNGTLTCVGVYNGSYVALGANCL